MAKELVRRLGQSHGSIPGCFIRAPAQELSETMPNGPQRQTLK
jgi:hypothetical protein